MARRISILATALAAAVTVCLVGRAPVRAVGAATVTARRLTQNPLITLATSATLGDNINGPTVIRAPDGLNRPLGRYYLYFAHHMGDVIRLAYANSITGPWTVYEPGVLHVRDTAFFRPQPDPAEALDDFYTHIASPEVYVDRARERVLMWFHGWWTEGQQWPARPGDARDWARGRGYGQFTQVAESTDGIHFETRPGITRENYLRVFQYGDSFYGMARLGRLLRTMDPLAGWELGPNPFRESTYANRVRHVAVVLRGHMLYVFFSGIADTPERILMSTIDLTGDWTTWRASDPVDVLQPETPYECAGLPNVPSLPGDVKGKVRQLRDPFVFDEDGKMYLFYSICGEQGIAAAELAIR